MSVTPGRWAGGLLPCASGRLRDSHQPAGRASSKARPPLRPGAGLLWPRSRRYQVIWGSPMAGSAPPVTFITEPVIATRPVRLLADRLILPVRGRTHGIDLGIGNRLAVDRTSWRCPASVSVTTSATRYRRSRTCPSCRRRVPAPPSGRPGVSYTNGRLTPSPTGSRSCPAGSTGLSLTVADSSSTPTSIRPTGGWPT